MTTPSVIEGLAARPFRLRVILRRGGQTVGGRSFFGGGYVEGWRAMVN